MTGFIAPIFYKLLSMSLSALAIGAVIMLIRKFADKKLSPFWKYTMWGLVLAALLLPWRHPGGPALMDSAAKVQNISYRQQYALAQSEYQSIQQQTPNPTPEQIQQLTDTKNTAAAFRWKTLIFDTVLPVLWLSGLTAALVFMLLSYRQLNKRIKNTKILPLPVRYELILQKAKEKLGIKHPVQIVLQSHVKTPALLGVFRPRIVLPEYLDTLGEKSLDHVILHELSHLKRKDNLVNSLLLALQAVYWFNPLTWLLFKFIREDMELANDAAVLKGACFQEQKQYSLSLLEVLNGYNKPASVPHLLSMADSEKNIERRILMIKMGGLFQKRRRIIALTSLLVIAVMAALFLTGMSREQEALKWAKNLRTEDIAQIEVDVGDVHNYEVNTMIVEGKPVTYRGFYSHYELSAAEAEQFVSFLNQTKGRCVSDLMYPYGPSLEVSFYITMKDGSEHHVFNLGNEYLEIDNICFQVDPQWLSNGLTNYPADDPCQIEFNFTGYETDEEVLPELYRNKTRYIGYTPKTSQIIGFLTVHSLDNNKTLWDHTGDLTLSGGTITNTHQKINYEAGQQEFDYYSNIQNQTGFQQQALIFLALVDNAEYIQYCISNGSEELILTYTRKWANTVVGMDIRECAKDFETFQSFVIDDMSTLNTPS